MTSEELAQIRERAEKATEGKWSYTLTTPEYDTYFIGSANVDGTFTPIGNINGEVDAAFIAHSREDIPRLISYIAYLREGLDSIADGWGGVDDPRQLSKIAEYYLEGRTD